jgi:hypothetical protein
LWIAYVHCHFFVPLSPAEGVDPESYSRRRTANGLVVRADDWTKKIDEDEREESVDENIEREKRNSGVSSQTYAASPIDWRNTRWRVKEANDDYGAKAYNDKQCADHPKPVLPPRSVGSAQGVDSLD